MKISIIVPFYNAELYIDSCCKALLAQNYPKVDYEIIMVNNNSRDGSADIVARYPLIKLLEERKQGAYAARNRGIEAATGEIFAFTDPDCIPAVDWLSQIRQAFLAPRNQVIVGSYLPSQPSFSLSVLTNYDNEKNRYIFSSQNEMLYYGYTNNLAARSYLFQKLGVFVERLRGADVLFTRKVVTHYGCDAVNYVEAMRVKHLEIIGRSSYYQKAQVHGESLQQLKRTLPYRPLNYHERLRVYLSLSTRHNYQLTRRLVAFYILLSGLVYWLLGEFIGRYRSKHQ